MFNLLTLFSISFDIYISDSILTSENVLHYYTYLCYIIKALLLLSGFSLFYKAKRERCIDSIVFNTF